VDDRRPFSHCLMTMTAGLELPRWHFELASFRKARHLWKVGLRPEKQRERAGVIMCAFGERSVSSF
jgi:hypothetical protein